MPTILIIDEDPELCDQVSQYLKNEGFDTQAIHNGEEGLDAALNQSYQAIIMEVLLPGIGGFEILRRLRAVSQVPVIILSTRGDEVDRVLGLELGADDYLSKPFSTRELVARIRAVLRRTLATHNEPVPDSLQIQNLELDSGAHSVKINNEPLELTSVEFKLLELLMRSAGKTVTREEIAKDVLGRELAAFDRSIDTHVSNLRHKIGSGRSGSRIKTIRGTGYVFIKPSAKTKE